MKQNKTKTTKQLLQYAAALMLFFIGVTACNKNDDMSPNGDQRMIQLTAYKPDNTNPTSKAASKEAFNKGDRIHVSANFTLKGGTSSEAYACMEYDASGNWAAAEGTKLIWPLDAANATFTAYYIPNAPSALADNSFVAHLSFSELSVWASTSPDKGDPLKATCTDVVVGGAVYLQFEHMCTKLTFTELDADVSELHLSGGNLVSGLTMKREGGRLIEGFTTDKSAIINKAIAREVSFLLPKIDAGEELRLFNIYTPYHQIVTPHSLEVGNHYKLDITKLSDNGYSEDYKEEQWGKNPLETIKFSAADIETYLSAISNGRPYVKDDVQILAILREGSKNVVTQLRDVSFEQEEFTPVNISTNIIFNGNGRTVKGVRISKDLDGYGALFGKNEGEIKNLTLEDVSFDNPIACEYVGTLAAYNSGKIDNVKIKFMPGNQVQGAILNGKQLWVGGLVGSNGGVLENVLLSGKFTVLGENDTDKIAHIGGLAGQSSGRVLGCVIHDVTANTTGSGTFRIGGFIGTISEGGVSQCAVNGVVNVLNTVAVVRAGGFAGYSTANEAFGAVTECSSNATVSVESATQASVGGFVGQIENSIIDNCHATGKVEVSGSIQTPRGVAGLVGWLSYKGMGNMSRSCILNCSTISAVDTSSGALVGLVAENDTNCSMTQNGKSSIVNSFSKNLAAQFVVQGTGVNITNWHHNGFDENGRVTVAGLNLGSGSGLQWTDTPNLYDVPYLNRTK